MKLPADAGQVGAGQKEPQADKHVGFQGVVPPFRIAEGHAGGRGQVVNADDDDEGGVLLGPDETVHERGQAAADGLWQHDKPGGLPVGHAERLGRFALSSRQ